HRNLSATSRFSDGGRRPLFEKSQQHPAAGSYRGTDKHRPKRGVLVPTSPIDATTTDAWRALSEHRDAFRGDLRGWFAADPQRAERLTRTAGDLHVDLSKNLLTDETLELLVRLADEVGLRGRIDAMFA